MAIRLQKLSLDFLSVFDINKSELYESKFGNYQIEFLYRGHENYEWDLIPSYFREMDSSLLAAYTIGNGVQQNEFYNFIRFIKEMDDLGLNVDNDSFQLTKILNSNDRLLGITKTDEMLYFPKEQNLLELALAQHHGIPTRLLDFTTSPLISIFFATEKLFPFSKIDLTKKIGVWAIPKLLLEVVQYENFLKLIDVKKYQNRHISAQKGVFVIYIPPVLNSTKSVFPYKLENNIREIKTLNEVFSEEFKPPSSIKLFKNK